MRFRAKIGTVFERLPYILYQELSDFGNSIIRPTVGMANRRFRASVRLRLRPTLLPRPWPACAVPAAVGLCRPRLVDALQADGLVVTMIGDLPALERAVIGADIGGGHRDDAHRHERRAGLPHYFRPAFSVIPWCQSQTGSSHHLCKIWWPDLCQSIIPPERCETLVNPRAARSVAAISLIRPLRQ